MKKSLFLIIISLLVLSSVMFAGGKEGKVSGVISGAHCGVNGMACAASHDLRRSELPGIYTKDNKFYAVANVPQSFLAQFPAKDVTVEGTVYEQERGIHAKKISVKEKDAWKTVFEDGSIVDGMGHKDKLSSAVEMDGKWFCSNCATMMHKKEEKK